MTGQNTGGDGKDALADYMRALNKLNGSKKASAASDAESPAEAGAAGPAATPASPAPTPANPTPDPAGDDTMSQYLRALERAKSNGSAAPAQGSSKTQEALKAARAARPTEATAPQADSAELPAKPSGVFRRGLDRLQHRGSRPSPAPKKLAPRRIPAEPDPVPEAALAAETAAPEPEASPRKAKPRTRRKLKPSFKLKPGKAAPRAGGSAAPFNASPRTLKTGALFLSLLAGLLLQRLIYHLGDMPYALSDLAIGATLVLPVLLILVLVRPETRSDWTALLASATAIAVTGGLGIALGVSLLHANALAMNETAYPIQLLVHLVILSVLWGPVFLIVAGLLHRMELLKLSDPVQSR